jgi:hypothetical protein
MFRTDSGDLALGIGKKNWQSFPIILGCKEEDRKGNRGGPTGHDVTLTRIADQTRPPTPKPRHAPSRAAVGRAADTARLPGWVRVFWHGVSAADVARDFQISEEYRWAHASMTADLAARVARPPTSPPEPRRPACAPGTDPAPSARAEDLCARSPGESR